jgi:hypothetical protein
VLGLATALYERTSQRPLAATARGDEERQLTLTYRGGPLAPETSGTGTSAGDRAPDAPYLTADGETGTLFDAFRGPHFTLIALGHVASDTAGTLDWPDVGARLRTVVLGDAANPVLRRTYGLGDSDACVLVRPDGYVAAVARDAASALAAAPVAMLPPVIA